jgi:hypothetical protein
MAGLQLKRKLKDTGNQGKMMILWAASGRRGTFRENAGGNEFPITLNQRVVGSNPTAPIFTASAIQRSFTAL